MFVMREFKEIYDTAECVMPGHPDKLADQISDALLDAQLRRDPLARVALETMVTANRVIVAGEVAPHFDRIEAEQVIRDVIQDVGYIDGAFNYRDVKIDLFIQPQSRELSSVTNSEGANDQSIVYGFATNESAGYIPMASFFANYLMEGIFKGIKSGVLPPLGPDGKILVKIKYNEKNRPEYIEKMILSLQHPRDADLEELRGIMYRYIISLLANHDPSMLPEKKAWLNEENFFFNPGGTFIKGGPESDTGLTGRKIIMDNGGAGLPSGGGAFSGKDGSKIDRAGAYAARFAARYLVTQGKAKTCFVKMVYCIGRKEPISIDCWGTDTTEEQSSWVMLKDFFAPAVIFSYFGLYRPFYRKTANFGHFGRGIFPWDGGGDCIYDYSVLGKYR